MARTRLLALCAVSAASAFAPRPYLGVTASRRVPVSTVVMMGGAKNGIFTPVVRLAKRLVGKERFLSFRGRVIGAHTKVIQAFVDTSDSPFGCLALEKLFEMADLDGDGTIDRDELEKALKKLGFYHLSGAQLDAIMKRADEDDNCVIDYDEFVKEAPHCVEIKIIRRVRRPPRHRRDACSMAWRCRFRTAHPSQDGRVIPEK